MGTSQPALIRITYRKGRTATLEPGRFLRGLLLTQEDVHLLRLVSARDFTIELQCRGAPTFRVQIHALLERIVPTHDGAFWYFPLTRTAPITRAET